MAVDWRSGALHRIDEGFCDPVANALHRRLSARTAKPCLHHLQLDAALCDILLGQKDAHHPALRAVGRGGSGRSGLQLVEVQRAAGVGRHGRCQLLVAQQLVALELEAFDRDLLIAAGQLCHRRWHDFENPFFRQHGHALLFELLAQRAGVGQLLPVRRQGQHAQGCRDPAEAKTTRRAHGPPRRLDGWRGAACRCVHGRGQEGVAAGLQRLSRARRASSGLRRCKGGA